jgi:uncharacterized protein
MSVIDEKGFLVMEFSGTETIDAPIAQVWTYLLDAHQVAACTPGLQSLEDLGAEHWKSLIAIGVGPVKTKFTLDATRPEKHEPDLMVVQAHGKASGSTVDLAGKMRLSATDAEHTRMDWTAQVAVNGTIASIGARLLHEAAEKLTRQFFDCLKAKLQTAQTARSAG